MEQFLHGVEVVEVLDGARPIRTVRTGVNFVVGTAPNANPDVFPENVPVLVAGSRSKAAELDTVGTKLGTLPRALDGILDQVGAVTIVQRVPEGADETETLANIIGGVEAGSGRHVGLYGALAAKSVVGLTPKIFSAPGFTHQRPADAANPVVAEALGILDRLRAIMVIDGASTTDAAAVLAAGDWGSRRLYMVDPRVKVGASGAELEWASARVAGLIARMDADQGFWWSPSNQEVRGIVGTERAVDFRMGDTASAANLLNEQNVATIIREDGFRLWGNRTLSSDPRFAFLSVVRTFDAVADSVQAAHLWAVDRNITRTYLEDVAEGVNAYLRRLTLLEAIHGGECFPDPDLNSAESIAAGRAWFNYAISPTTPAERITFRASVTDEFVEEVLV